MGARRTVIEKIIVATLSLAIAAIFVVATKPWKARLPHDHRPAHSSSQSSTGR